MTTTRAQQPDAKTALARRREDGVEQTGGPNLADQIRQMERQFQLAMPRGVEAVQLVRDALTALRTTRNLAKCEPKSVLGGLMTCAQLGLRPGVLGHAWLLPFWDSRDRIHKAQLVIGYQGYTELAHRSGRISSLIARTVYANDEFEVDYGLADSLVHKPAMFGDRGEPIAYYAIAKFTSGGHAFIVMTHDEMTTYRDRYAMARTREGKIVGPWVDQFEGMAQKTCVRQLAKWMPKSTDLAIAISADEGVRVDLSPDLDAAETTDHPTIQGEVVNDQQGEPAVEPAAEGEAAAEQQDQPADEPPEGDPITDAQSKNLHRLFGKVGWPDRDDYLRAASALLGRQITTTKDLTKQEASGLIEDLDQIAQGDDPQGTLAQMVEHANKADGQA